MSWSSMHSSVQNLLPEYRISSSDTNIHSLHNGNRDRQNSEWIIDQSSSDPEQNQVDPNGGMTGITCAMQSEAVISLGERQSEPPTIFSSNITDVTLIGNITTSSSLLLHNSSVEVLPKGLHVRHKNNEDVDNQIHESHNNSISIGSMNERITSIGGAFDGLPSGFGGRENRSGSLNGRRTSCKRKAFDVVGESSGTGSSNRYESTERSQWHTSPAAPVTVSNNRLPVLLDGNPGIINGPELANSRVGTVVGEAVAATPFSFLASETAATYHRSFSFHINGSLMQYPFHVDASSNESFDASSSRNSPRLVIINPPFDLNPEAVSENGSLHGQSALLHVPFVRRNLQSRWSAPSSSRTNRSSTSAISLESNAVVSEEANRRNLPRDISDHPIFVPASDRRSSSQHPVNWNFASGNNSVAGNVTSTSYAGSSYRVNSPPFSNRSYPHYSRRLSDVVRRSMLSSARSGYGTQSTNLAPHSSSIATSQESAFTFGSDSQGNHLLNLRATLVEQRPDGAGAIPYPHRTLSSSSEGRSAIMSEQIRRVLDIMRRGEGLRLEDVTLLDHSIFSGMADIHDRHRDMRLDVDNMSYEELLALEESIGDVCTGLNEEKITNGLKIKKHVGSLARNPVESSEPCSICREEYIAGDDIGTLDCSHDFHKNCIKQWLVRKNVCPICKTTGLS